MLLSRCADSPLDVDFVTGATNMRAFTFGIPLQSRFDVKSIAGNIIPAIAASNAMVAGTVSCVAV
jgi:ubiquitin-like 1-activating enzyme E1 B